MKTRQYINMGNLSGFKTRKMNTTNNDNNSDTVISHHHHTNGHLPLTLIPKLPIYSNSKHTSNLPLSRRPLDSCAHNNKTNNEKLPNEN